MKLFLLLCSFCLLYGEIHILFELYRTFSTTQDFLSLHFMLGIITISIGYLLRSKKNALTYFLQLSLWNTLAGPFGIIIAASLIFVPENSFSNDFDTWLKQQADTDQSLRLRRLRSELRYDRLRIEGPSGINALADIFRLGTREHKFDALAAIGRRFQQDLQPLIQIAVNDHDASVRVLAFAVKLKIQQQRQATIPREQSTMRQMSEKSGICDPDFIDSTKAAKTDIKLNATTLAEQKQAFESRTKKMCYWG